MQNEENTKDTKKEEPKKVDESGSILVDGFIKIFDPNTDEVFINKRDS